jgi:hypothetical protein
MIRASRLAEACMIGVRSALVAVAGVVTSLPDFRAVDPVQPTEAPLGGSPPSPDALSSAPGFQDALRWMVVGAGLVVCLALLAAALLVASKRRAKWRPSEEPGSPASFRST